MVRVDVVFRPCGRQARVMVRVVVTGAASTLGRRVVALLADRSDVDHVVAYDIRSGPGIDPIDLVTADLVDAFDGAESVVHLASAFGPAIDGPEIDSHIIDWDKFLPRFGQFRAQEAASRTAHGLG